MPGYGAWTPQSPIQSLHFETVLARYECPTRPDIGTMLTDHGVIVSPRGQYAALCISNFKFQISNFKFQISNLKSQISNRGPLGQRLYKSRPTERGIIAAGSVGRMSRMVLTGIHGCGF